MAPPRLIAKSAHDEATVLDGEVPTSLLVNSTSFLANGHPILKEVPANITATPWVDANGVIKGVKGLVKGGCPPGMVVIDNGWQSICLDDDPIDKEGMDRAVTGEEIPYRLVKFEEDHEFKDYESAKLPNTKGMSAVVSDLKEEFKTIEYVYMWEALCGYWGGIKPNVLGMLEAKAIEPKWSPGFHMFMEDFATNNISRDGIRIVQPEMANKMYEGLQSHLESTRIDGIKIDVIQVLEMLGEDFRGRVELAITFYKALTTSLRKYFKGNDIIASMEQCNDFLFLGTEAITLGRAGMSLGALRLQQPMAISGEPVYVSDSVGQHNFKLLKSLVLPDGSILRCHSCALPTRDCLFEDPLHDGKTMLKDLEPQQRVVGVFNCQGGGWFPKYRKTKRASKFLGMVGCLVYPKNIEWRHGKDTISIQGAHQFAVYIFQRKYMKLMKFTEKIEISQEPLNYELLTVSPVTILPIKSIGFCPIGLVNMLNSGRAIQSIDFDDDGNSVRIGVKGKGEMGVFATEKPISCKIDGVDVGFSYNDQMVSIEVSWPNFSRAYPKTNTENEKRGAFKFNKKKDTTSLSWASAQHHCLL
ncbi:hypothetical protein SLEP1_g56479 [Rubroshorea leprosula]|uniref:Galactinol--sucrose galactosyltransferase n=1 Tax=Rubroshorea leprosula TaxID=152421 RepID=A0AAV5MIW0_9ROSI|nr:hypothetical protein SLEP1_g56479 [Rubroshorea leprosula]